VRVHVAFTPAERIEAPLAIVVDVLRATSTMTQALASGYERVLCCAEIDEARALKEQEAPAVTGGERKTTKIPGFDFGNSPREYAGKPAAPTLVLSTTNGTRLLVTAVSTAETVLVGSLLNLEALAREVRASGAEEVAILCAGVLGELALDDAYCAGRIAQAIGGDATDSATAAIKIAEAYPSAVEGLAASQSARNLHLSGLDGDIEWCARESAIDVVARFTRMVGTAAEVALRD
jgi:2-phosphosulfolactate phosphatase